MDYLELDQRRLFAFRTYRRLPTKVTTIGRVGVTVRRILNRFRGHGSGEDPFAYVGAPINPASPKLRSTIRLPCPRHSRTLFQRGRKLRLGLVPCELLSYSPVWFKASDASSRSRFAILITGRYRRRTHSRVVSGCSARSGTTFRPCKMNRPGDPRIEKAYAA